MPSFAHVPASIVEAARRFGELNPADYPSLDREALLRRYQLLSLFFRGEFFELPIRQLAPTERAMARISKCEEEKGHPFSQQP